MVESAELLDDEDFFEGLVDLLNRFESQKGYPESSVRETVTGPFIDTVMRGREFRKVLLNGVHYSCRYKGKITREFALAPNGTNSIWEPQTVKLILALSTRWKRAMIGGAYFGDQAMVLANQFRETGGTVYAFEPDSTQYEMLCLNRDLNGFDNLQCINSALWDEASVAIDFEGSDELASPKISESGKGVISTTVDQYSEEHLDGPLDFLMLDVEGGEYRALLGAEKALQEDLQAVIFESNSRYSDWSDGLENSESCQLLSRHGFEVFAIRDYHRCVDTGTSPVELVPVDKTFIEGPPHGFNLIAVRDPSSLEEPIVKIVEDVSPKLLPGKGDPRFDPVFTS